jgi:hypothetical protein
MENEIHIQIQQREFVFPLHTTFLEVRRKIAEEMFDIPNGYVELYNNSPRIYKDYGKFFFDYGIIPSTFDYYPLSDITIGGRTFIFHASPDENRESLKRDIPTSHFTSSTRLYHDRFKQKRQKTDDSNTHSTEFIFHDEDFPSLT